MTGFNVVVMLMTTTLNQCGSDKTHVCMFEMHKRLKIYQRVNEIKLLNVCARMFDVYNCLAINFV